MSPVTYYYKPVPYKKSDGSIIEILRPLIPIRIGLNHRPSKFAIDCLVDSGSDRNLFPAELAEAIDIKVKSVTGKCILGIGDSQLKAYTHKIEIYIHGQKKTVDVDFCYEQRLPLLGREGFFNQFKNIIFDENAKFVEIVF